MFNNNFVDLETSSIGQNGNETMHFSVELDLIQNLAAVTFESTIVIVETYSRKFSYQPVKNLGRERFVYRVMSNFFPA